jgi:hypothetical protein
MSAKVSEEDGVQLGVEERIRSMKGVRYQTEPRLAAALVEGKPPPKCPLGALDDLHGYCINHLLVKSWVGLARLKAVAHEQ